MASFGEETQGDAMELSRETVLLKGPKLSSEPVGKLPKGTILTFQGEKENGFVFVRVELVEGDAEGWVSEKNIQVPSESKDIKKASNEAKTPVKPKGRLKRGGVPADEALLLKREPSFLYGLYLGGNFNVINTPFTQGLYTGMGFTAGGHLGFFVTQEVVLRGELGYTLTNGAGADGNVAFGLVDVGAHLDYNIDRFVLSAGIQYSAGIGVGDIPKAITIGSAADVSALWGVFGGGVRFNVSEVVSFVLRGRYGISFARAPVGFQTIGLLGFLEVRG